MTAGVHVYDIKALNAQGWAETQDVVTGEEGDRSRSMAFCVVHGEKALCGLGQVAYLITGPEGDLTQQALKIIRSIEFLPDEAAPATSEPAK